jgi:hypothetical protein
MWMEFFVAVNRVSVNPPSPVAVTITVISMRDTACGPAEGGGGIRTDESNM